MPTLLFLHGALGAASQFDSLVSKLQNEYACHAIDFPIHGQNRIKTDFSIPHFANYLIKIIEESYTAKVFVFGYSMGGYVAMYAANLRPDLFEGVITLATKFKWTKQIADKEKAMLNAEEMERKIPTFVEQLKQRHIHIDWKEMIENTASLLDSLGKENILSQERLNSIPIKVMVGLGDHDVMVTFDETIETYKQLQQGSLYVLPQTKHPFEKVNEELLISHIKRFLSC